MSLSNAEQAAKVILKSVRQYVDRKPWNSGGHSGTFKTNAWNFAVLNGTDRDVAATITLRLMRGGAYAEERDVHFDWIDPGETAVRSFSPFSDSQGGTYVIHRMTVRYNGENITRRMSMTIGERSSNSDGCFVATAVCEDEDAWMLSFLRDFRDQRLVRSRAGQKFIRIYDHYGPRLANSLVKYRKTKRVTRVVIIFMVAVLRFFYGSNSTVPPRP